MTLGEAIRYARKKAFCTQRDLADELQVALSTVNRWEMDKVRPNMRAMKGLKAFCDKNWLPFDEIEKAWTQKQGE